MTHGEGKTVSVASKWYVNGFPKAGTHMALRMLMPYVRPLPERMIGPRLWEGSFADSWKTEPRDLEWTLYGLSCIQPAHYLKGHCGHTDTIQAMLWYCGTAVVFVFRDLRDVAVSQAYHILSDDPILKHSGRDKYKALGGFNAVLSACITGLEDYPGLLERWEHYAPWLDVPWVFKFQYEEARTDPHSIAVKLIHYGLDRIAPLLKVRPRANEDDIDAIAQAMVQSVQDTSRSPTYRKGTSGQWKTSFTETHKRQFKEHDTENWLVRLGYEDDQNW